MTIETVFGRRQSASTAFGRVYPARLATGLIIAMGFHATVILIAYFLALGPVGGNIQLNRIIELGTTPSLAQPKVSPTPVTPSAQGVVPEKANPVMVEDVPDAVRPVEKEIATGTGVTGESGTGTGDADGDAGADNPAGVDGLTDDGLGDVPYTFVENPPVPIHQVTPEYPALAKLAGIEGTVYLRLLVDREGKVTKVRVVQSDKDIFNENAIEAARQWIFRPGETAGGTVAVWVSVPFRFKILQ